MLEGTELNYAYSPIISDQHAMYEPYETLEKPTPPIAQQQLALQQHAQQQHALQQQHAPPQQKMQKLTQSSNPIMEQVQHAASLQQAAPQQRKSQQPIKQNFVQFDQNMFNQQFEQEQKLMAMLNEMKKRPQQQQQQPVYQEEGYVDKLMSKKKDVLKFIQSGLIILFAISLHFVIDFVLKKYLETHDVSYNRELLIRILYPVGIVFIAWNVIAALR
jgi:hypothetical protein